MVKRTKLIFFKRILFNWTFEWGERLRAIQIRRNDTFTFFFFGKQAFYPYKLGGFCVAPCNIFF
jgi:hypothetical protein